MNQIEREVLPMIVPNRVQAEKMEGLAREVMQFSLGEAAVYQSGLKPAGAHHIHMAAGHRRGADAV